MENSPPTTKMWQLYLRYHTTEGTHDVSGDVSFATLEEAEDYVADQVYDDYYEHEGVDENDDYIGKDRYPGNWERIPDDGGSFSDYGHWYELPEDDDAAPDEVPLAFARLHSQHDWAFRDDVVLFYAKRT